MASTFFTFPSSVLQAGQTYGPQVTPQIGAVSPNYLVNVQQLGTWPAGDCIQIIIEYSQDGGVTWRFDSGATFVGGTWPSNPGSLGIGMGTVAGNALAAAVSDLFRVTVKCLQSVAALVTMGHS